MRIGINASAQLLDPNLDSLIAHAQQAEADGFSSWWLAQTGLVDALSVFLAASSATSTIEMGTAVIPTYPRHPFTLAGQVRTTNMALRGRLVAGVGLSHKPVVEYRLGMSFDKPVGHMADYLTILDDLLTTGTTAHDGDAWTMHGEFGAAAEPAPSIMVAAMGPQMLRLAGRRTDGTILWMVGPKTIASHIVPEISEAAADAGRGDPRVMASLPVCVTDDEDATRAFAAVAFANYGELPSYRAMLDREGAEGPADVCLIGDEVKVRNGLAAIAAAGATDFAAVEIGMDEDQQRRTRALLQEVNAA